MAISPVKITTQPLSGYPDLSAQKAYAQALLAAGGRAGPVQHWTQALARALQGAVGGYLAGDIKREEQKRSNEYSQAITDALGAEPIAPWRPPEDVYRQEDLASGAGEAAAPGHMVLPGATPVLRAGEPAPGTGTSRADLMIQALEKTPGTAPLALQLRFNQQARAEDALAAANLAQTKEDIKLRGTESPEHRGAVAGAEAGAREGVFMGGRGAPRYIQDTSRARQAGIEAARLEGTQSPANLQAAAQATAAGTREGQGEWKLLTDADIRERGLNSNFDYRQSPTGKIEPVTSDDRAAYEKYAVAAGYTPGTPEYQKFIKDAVLSKPTIQVGDTAQTASIKAMAKVHEKQLSDMETTAHTNVDVVPRLQSTLMLLESGRTDTNAIKNFFFPLRQLVVGGGFYIDDKLPVDEQVKASLSYLVPRQRVIGTGSTSNMEMNEFRRAGPNFMNTTLGNVKLIRSYLQIDDRNRKAYELAQEYYATPRGPDQIHTMAGFDEYADQKLGPVFPVAKAPSDTSPMQPGEVSIEDIPPGTMYFDPYRKQFDIKRGPSASGIPPLPGSGMPMPQLAPQ